MASSFMKVGQHNQWLMPQICPGGSRQSDLGSLSYGRARQHNSLSSLSSISSFSRRALLPQTDIHGMRSNRGVACSARLAPGIPTEVYVVKRGDWLSDVAAARNMDVYDLKELNPSLDLDNIYVGQEIIVPVMKPAIAEDPPAPPAPPPPSTAVAPSPAPPSPAVIEAAPAQGRDKPGSGKLSLGNLFGRHEAATAVVEPAAEAETESDDGFSFEVYTMKRGEWVSSVASRFGVTLDELRAANPNVNLDNVRPKQSILIPRPTPEPLARTLADPGSTKDMCAPPTASPSPAPQLNAKPPPPDMCAPPAPKPTVTNVASQGTGKGGAMLLDGSAGRKQQQGQKQQSRKGGGSNSEANMCCAPPPNPPSQSTAGLSSSSSSGSEVYVVKRGDWMSTVATDRGLSLDELRQLNPGLNLDRVRVGQEILVPRKEAATAVPPVPDENVASEYMIQPGDFMDTIAQRHGVSISDIVELNSLSYDEPIQVGQTIYIPKPKPPEFELTTSTLSPEVGMPPMPPLVVGGLMGVGTALLTIAAIGFALSDRGPPAASATGLGSPSPPPGSRQVRGRPVVVAAESSSTSAVAVAASASAAAAAGEPPLASSAGPRMSGGGAGGEGRPIKMGSTNGNGNGNGSGFSSSGNGNGAVRSQNRKSASSSSSSGERRGGARGSSSSQGPSSTGLPPEVERATLAAVEAVRGGGAQGPGALRVGDGYARADSVTSALQDAVRAAVVSLGSAPATVALAAIGGGRGDADSGSYSRTEEAVLLLRKILPRDCTLHGVNAGGGEAASRDEGSQEWAAVLLLSAPDVIVSSSVALGYGGARLASQQAIESMTTKVSGKKQIKSVVVNASPGLGPTAVEEVASMLPGVPAYSVSAGRGMATSEWQVIAGPSASAVSPGISAIGLTADAEFGGAFLATVTGQWLYGPRSVVAARPPSVAISRS